MSKEAAKTGSGPAAIAAVEQYFPEGRRILTDHLASAILPTGARACLRLMRFPWARDWMFRLTEKTAPGLWGGMLCRKRFIDEKLIESAGGIGCVLNLGAGSDTKVYRLPALAQMPVWEADQRENIDAKRMGLRRVFGAVPANVTLVAIDFDREELGAVLEAHGFRLGIPAFFIWEAVSQYLTEPGFRATFQFFAKAAPGSRLVFTYVRQDFIDGRVLYGQEDMYNRYVKKGVWLFGLEPESVQSLLSSYGWRLIEDRGYAELAELYVKPTGRELSSMEVERIVYAEKL